MQKTRPSNLFIETIFHDEFFLKLEWSNGHTGKIPLIFMHDNAPGVRHVNGQKTLETAKLNINDSIEIVAVAEDQIIIKWENDVNEYVFTTSWFLQHNFVHKKFEHSNDSTSIAIVNKLWDHDLNFSLPEGSFSDITNDKQALFTWLDHIVTYGFAILREVPPTSGMITEVVKLFGYVRETNYGKIFDVKTIVNPNNLAYTGLGISAHTDNPYRYPTPTLQLLHCLSSDASGGDSILADSFKIAEDLRVQHPSYFTILSTVMVTFQFRDEENWLEDSSPIISLHEDGRLKAIRINNRSIQPVKLPPDELLEFYKAYLQFARMMNEDKYSVRFKLAAGDLYIVDNERVTHARSAYDNKAGERWLQGAYADRDALLSKWRVLKLLL